MTAKKKSKLKAVKQKESEEKILGIDDSGRGPVIGPMVMAGVMLTRATEKQFQELGIKDSKLLSPNRREKLSEVIKENSSFSIIKIWPQEIEMQNRMRVNLNKIEAIKSAQLINEFEPDIAIIDCPSPNIPAWQVEVEKHIIVKKPKLIVKHKADFLHTVVGAASILAKVTRDDEIEKIQRNIPEPVGSGYPSDPITQKFLKENWNKEEYSNIFRKTWAPFMNHKKASEQKKLEEF